MFPSLRPDDLLLGLRLRPLFLLFRLGREILGDELLKFHRCSWLLFTARKGTLPTLSGLSKGATHNPELRLETPYAITGTVPVENSQEGTIQS
jgi:hypothetical protein